MQVLKFMYLSSGVLILDEKLLCKIAEFESSLPGFKNKAWEMFA